MVTEKIENSLLALMQRDGALEGRVAPTLVHLSPGPMHSAGEEAGAWAYFPIDALIGLTPAHSAGAVVAVVGCHGCVMSSVAGQPMQAHVVSPGRAYRLHWSQVRQDPQRFAPWLWHAAAATQSLIGQMAQWSFCAQHHSPTQRLASWLLHGMAQTPHAELQLSWTGLPQGMQQWLQCVAPATPETRDARGYALALDGVRATSSERLMAQACTCHAHLSQPKPPPL